MNKTFLVSVLKENWYLVLAVLAFPAVGIIMALRPEAPEVDVPVPVAATATVNTTASSTNQNLPWQVANPRDGVEASIQNYHTQLKHGLNDEERPGVLARMANLYYSKQGDYDNAALYYEILMQDHPDFDGNKVSYSNLASCYERMKETDLARATYRRMRDHFGPGTKEYEFADYKLTAPANMVGH